MDYFKTGIILLTLASAIDCDLSTGAACLYSGDLVLKPYARMEGLSGYWSFDDNLGLDYSGSQNHALNAVAGGHSFSNQGASAYFDGNHYLEVPSDSTLNLEVFSISFWIYIQKQDNQLQDKRLCPVLQKGEDNDLTYERAPAIFLDTKEKFIQVNISTEESSKGEYLKSNARLQNHRWYHLGLVRAKKSIYLYVNGILDSTNSTEGSTLSNESPLYIGNTPACLEKCSLAFLMDELKFFNGELSEKEIGNESFGSLGQIEAEFVKFGCSSCTVLEASNYCEEGYHLCTTIELHSGAYAVARIMGWTQLTADVWSHDALRKSQEEDLGLGICCKDLG